MIDFDKKWKFEENFGVENRVEYLRIVIRDVITYKY